MLRHPLVALIRRSRHYRVLISGFVIRMTGAYTATLAAVWGAWRYGSDGDTVYLHMGVTLQPHRRTGVYTAILGWRLDRAVRDGWAVDGAPGFAYTTDWAGAPVVRTRMHWVAAEAIGAAAGSAALEELRVRYLGRKAELPNLLRGVAELPPEEPPGMREGS